MGRHMENKMQIEQELSKLKQYIKYLERTGGREIYGDMLPFALGAFKALLWVQELQENPSTPSAKSPMDYLRIQERMTRIRDKRYNNDYEDGERIFRRETREF